MISGHSSFSNLTHNVCLSSDGYQAVDVLADRYQNLSSHVSTLLGSWSLILNVYASCTLLDEELGELHDRRKTSMSSIRISNDWSQVVDIGEFGAIGLCRAETLLALLSVVEELCHEQMANLVRYSCLKINEFLALTTILF